MCCDQRQYARGGRQETTELDAEDEVDVVRERPALAFPYASSCFHISDSDLFRQLRVGIYIGGSRLIDEHRHEHGRDTKSPFQ